METIAFYYDQDCRDWKPDEEYNELFLKCQLAYFDHKLQTHGFVFLNEVLESLGIKRTKKGQTMGWSRLRSHTRIDMYYHPDINAEFLVKFEVEDILDDIDIINKGS